MDFPDEIQVDIFCHLDRLSLEALKLTRSRFEPLIDAKMGSACLRALVNVVLTLKKYKTFVVEAVLAAIDEVYDENGYIVPYFKVSEEHAWHFSILPLIESKNSG